MGNLSRSANGRNLNYSMKVFLSTFVGVLFGFFVGVSFPALTLSKFNFSSSLLPASGLNILGVQKAGTLTEETKASLSNEKESGISPVPSPQVNNTFKIWAPSNPHGAEMLPPGILATESDFYLRRLFGNPEEDLTSRPKYLVTFTVGYDQKHNIDAAVKKFSDNFTIVLFHYDGRTTEWDEFEWSKRAIHVSVRKQTKWWYAKRFLHPDIIATYDYIFIWDEDLGVEHFDAEEYIKLMKKHGLEISQPALEPNNKLVWQMTKKRDGVEVHKETEEKPGRCRDPRLPPCAGFIEIMAPVFTKDAWRCVWHMLQNDLVHGWGLDFALRRCVEPAHEKIGVIDAQWVVHQSLPSLGKQGEAYKGKEAWRAVRERCREEWFVFERRMNNAENTYFKSIGIDPSKFRKP